MIVIINTFAYLTFHFSIEIKNTIEEMITIIS